MTSINPKLFNFIVDKVGDRMTAQEAKQAGVANEFNEAIAEQDSYELEIADFSQDLIEKFAVQYENERTQKSEAKDKEQEKKEQTEVKSKDGAGV